MIRRTPGVALYAQLADLLRRQIEDGTYRPGAQIPSEEQLAETHDISRETVRRATALLRAEGLIEVQHGYGSWVRMPDMPGDLTVVAVQPGSRARVRPPTRAERAELDIEEGVAVLEVQHGRGTRVYPGDRYVFTFGER